MSNAQVRARRTLDLLGTDFATGRAELAQAFREEAQRAVAEQLAAGLSVYSCGTGAETGKLFVRLPNGRRFEYRVLPDGTEEIIRVANLPLWVVTNLGTLLQRGQE